MPTKGFFKSGTFATIIVIVGLIAATSSRGASVIEVLNPPGFEVFLRAVVLAPVCEEMFFRGYYQPKWESRLGRMPGLLVTASLFAVIHLPNMLPQYFARPFTGTDILLIFILGLLFGAARKETGSVYYSIAFHAVWNYVVS